MATLIVLKDLDFPVTRADLAEAWSTAQLSELTQADLEPTLESITLVSTFSGAPSEPGPGRMIWVADEQLVYAWHDAVDDTGVSLWLAIGPDVFETACILAEPAHPGAVLEATHDRWVRPAPYTEPYLADGVSHRLIGALHSGVPYPLNTRTPDTLASGTWVRVGIDGFVFGWIPNASGVSDNVYRVSEQKGVMLTDIDQYKGGTRQFSHSGDERYDEPGFCGIMPFGAFNQDTITGWGQHYRFRWLGYIDQREKDV